MKKFFLCTLLLIFSSGLYAQFSGSGSGTSNDPYLISNGDELNQIRNLTSANFKIINDIDLAAWIEDNNPNMGWNPIGSFSGVLDGDNFKILNFKINRPTTDNIGFFNSTNGAIIKNLKFEVGIVKGQRYVGSLIGYATNSTIDNCFSNLSVSGSGTDVGGIIGCVNNSPTITNNYFTGIVTGTNNCGGLIGSLIVESSGKSNSSNITDNSISSYINGVDNIGGLIGYIYAHSIGVVSGSWPSPVVGLSAYTTINITKNYTLCTINGGSNLGGLTGYCHNLSERQQYLKNLYSSSNIIISKNNSEGYIIGNASVGGIVGFSNNSNSIDNYYGESGFRLENNYFTGNLKGTGQTGGILGYIYSNLSTKYWGGYFSNINMNYSNSTIENAGSNSGGIIAKAANISITNNISITSLQSGISNVNKVLGQNESGCGFSNNLAWVKTVLLENSEIKQVVDDDLNGIGYGLSSLELKATYQGLGFDFTNTWNISNTESLPFFLWQTPPAEFTNNPFKPGSTTINGKCVSGAKVIIKVNDISFNTVATGNIWSIEVPALKAGDVLSVTAQTSGLKPSYTVIQSVLLNGDGTIANPYKIYTESDLRTITDLGSHYILMNDISLSNAWVPIGTQANSLRGSFDGNNHIISNLYITADVASLFYQTASTATIKNLHVKASATKTFAGQTYTAGIVAVNKGIIDSCSFSGNLSNTTNSGYIGGIAAANYGKINRTFCIGNRTSATASSFIGGLAGYNYGTINQAYSAGDISTSGATSYGGGLIGFNEGIVSNTNASGKVSATGATSYSGGLIAYNKKKVENSYSNSNVSSIYRASALVGYNDGTSAFSKNCVALGKSVSGNNSINRIVGGFANSAPIPVLTDNYANKDMIVTVNGNIVNVTDNGMQGTGKSLDQLRLQSNYSALSFNFDTIWHIKESVTFPYLFNIQSNSPEIVTPVYSGTSVALAGSHIENGSTVKVWTNKNSSAKYNTVVNGKWNVILDILYPNDSIFVTASTGLKGESFVINAIVIANTYTISASANPSFGGSFSGAKTYNSGEVATLSASPNAGYSFVNWTENGTAVSDNPNYSFTVNINRTLVANFGINIHTISLSALPVLGGSVSGGGTFNYGTTVSLTAVANTGYSFSNWSENGLSVSTNPSYNFSVNANRSLVANFTLNTHTVSISGLPILGGSVIGGGTFDYSSTVTVTATPNPGYKFVSWTENEVQLSIVNEYSFSVGSNRVLVAKFTLNTEIVDQLQTDIRIYPNPVQDVLIIDAPQIDMISVLVFDYLGRELITSIGKKVNISHLKPGFYFVKVNETIFKIVKE